MRFLKYFLKKIKEIYKDDISFVCQEQTTPEEHISGEVCRHTHRAEQIKIPAD